MKRSVFWFVLITFFSFLGSCTEPDQETFSEDHLAGTDLLSETEVEELRPRMLKGIFKYFEQALESSSQTREIYWSRNYSSSAAYVKSVEPNRIRLKKVLGVVDKREDVEELTLIEGTVLKALVAETDLYNVYSVSWPVIEGVHGVGFWLEPHTNVRAQVIAVPDADWTPEMFIGLSPGVPVEAQFPKRLAASGCRVIIPVLINRQALWSGNTEIQMTNQPHREFIYRRAYQMGRHIIGYEIQKVLAVVDWFTKKNRISSTDLPIAVAGYGEGGLIAFNSAAIDTRIDGVLVSGYFQEREGVWEEPIYRNVWGLLNEFGDAEVASLIAPRQLIIEACKGPDVDGPPTASANQRNVAAPGRLTTSPLTSVRIEAQRAQKVFQKLEVPEKIQVVVSGNGQGLPGSTEALQQLLTGIGCKTQILPPQEMQLKDRRINFDPDSRLHIQFTELLGHIEKLIEQSPKQRKKFWNEGDHSSVQQWTVSVKSYRDYFWKEVIGQLPPHSQSFNPRTRLTYETSKWRGYWVELDVWPEIIAGGVLLIPKDNF